MFVRMGEIWTMVMKTLTPETMLLKAKKAENNCTATLQKIDALANIPDKMLTVAQKRNLILELARKYKIEPEFVYAFLEIESSGQSFCSDGRPKIRFEPHIFCGASASGVDTAKTAGFDYKTTPWYDKNGKQAQEKWKALGYKHSRGCPQTDEWAAFAAGAEMSVFQAFASISVGGPQIMGFNYKMMGYASPEDLYNEFAQSETTQIYGFFRFVAKKNSGAILKASRRKDFVTCAKNYNGNGKISPRDYNGKTFTVKKYYYGEKIKVLYEKYKRKGLPQ